jgi:hypothetical protein
MEEPFTSMPIRFLTSASKECWTSLIIVSKDTELLNGYRNPVHGREIHYCVHAPMFMCDLLQMIAYGQENPKMSEIVADLHARIPNGRGYEAATCGTDGSQQWTLRDFFGPPVGLASDPHPLHPILPPAPAAGFTGPGDEYKCSWR